MFSLDRRRLPNIEERSPTARELLEASKSLYVKTEALRTRRIDPTAPRLFRTPSEEDFDLFLPTAQTEPCVCVQAIRSPVNNNSRAPIVVPKPLNATSSLNSTPRSAFKPFGLLQSPPRPPKSEALRRRQIELIAKPPSISSAHVYEQVNLENLVIDPPAPKPLPRLSLLKKKSTPIPPPRRRATTTLDELMPIAMTQSAVIEGSAHFRTQATSTTNLAQSTPDLTVDDDLTLDLNLVATPSTAQASISVEDSAQRTTNLPHSQKHSTLSRNQRTASQKPPRPPNTRRSGSSFPSPDGSHNSSRDSGVVDDAVYASDMMAADPDFAERIQRWERRRTLTTPPQLPIRPSKPTELAQHASGPSITSDATSEFTSISAVAVPIDSHPTHEHQEIRPVSLNEKNARVLSWIYGCSVVERV
ncbi:hypothetical protein M3Y98_00819700 [Aphelenchoides besseyi]|nr:hypothetical protein M3Y98_00819700 [Aphelenchoides besseyi]KAI6212208.1 hypothetical protein M3Y96_00516000 [Aphelenchoides besseyi]